MTAPKNVTPVVIDYQRGRHAADGRRRKAEAAEAEASGAAEVITAILTAGLVLVEVPDAQHAALHLQQCVRRQFHPGTSSWVSIRSLNDNLRAKDSPSKWGSRAARADHDGSRETRW